jgi:hypothetical protein
MTKRYVAINDEPHQILRGLTSTIPIVSKTDCEGFVQDAIYDLTGIAEKLPDLYFFISYPDNNEALLDLTDENKLSFAEKRRFFDATLVDRRCMGTCRLRLNKKGTSLFSAELLCFGAGALRQLWDNPNDPAHAQFRRLCGRIASLDMVVYCRIPATFYSPALQKDLLESWESTNIIYGDAYGEVEQIWRRRKDTSFLTGIAMALNQARKRPHADNFYFYYDAPVNVSRTHLDTQSIWTTPITSWQELLRRVRFILENTSLDSNPATILEDSHPLSRTQSQDQQAADNGEGAGQSRND